MKTEHLIFNLELIRNVQCVLKMTEQSVKPNTSTVCSPASKYKVGWASVLSRVLLPHLSTSGGDWPSVKEPCTEKGHKLLIPPHLAALQPSLTAFCKKRLSRVHTWHTGLWVRGQPGLHSFGTARDTHDTMSRKTEIKVTTISLSAHTSGSHLSARWGCRGVDHNIELNGDAG